MTAKPTHPFALAPCLALCFSACVPPTSICENTQTTSSAIKFGAPDAGVEPVPGRDAVFALHWLNVDEEPKLACTATRVNNGGFVTARHCIPEALGVDDDPSATGLWLHPTALDDEHLTGCSRTDPMLVERVTVHDALDLAVLHIDGAETPSSGTRVKIAADSPTPEQQLYIAGFGLSEDTTLGRLRALPAKLQGVTDTDIAVQGEGGGACVGDSGGPLYRFDPGTQTATLHGILSAGSATCLGVDLYVDLSRAKPWLDAALRAHSDPGFAP